MTGVDWNVVEIEDGDDASHSDTVWITLAHSPCADPSFDALEVRNSRARVDLTEGGFSDDVGGAPTFRGARAATGPRIAESCAFALPLQLRFAL